MYKAIPHDILTGRICPYCNGETEFIDSKVLYSSGISYGMVYACRLCDAWVGVHKGTRRALGRLADKELRAWKKEAHRWFDLIWKNDGKTRKVRKARSAAYRWLARLMNIDPAFCHIGMFDVDQCKMVVQLFREYYKDDKAT